MHELGISRNIVAIAAEAAAGRPVRRVTLEIGRLSGVVREALEFSFDLVAEGTELAKAVLEIREIEGRARCCECGTEFAVATLAARCACGSRRCTVVAGEELRVKSLDLED